jgi:hypothetical protein
MYLALFLGPWMLAYAISTLIMGHGLTKPQTYVLERELTYDGVFAPGAEPREQAFQLLSDLDLLGAYGTQAPNPAERLTIIRQDMLTPRRLIYTPADRHVRIEKVAFETTSFLNRFHHRRGYAQPFKADKLMALSIDAVGVVMLFWAFSGVWMWAEMPRTRRWGLVAMATGGVTFAALAVLL